MTDLRDIPGIPELWARTLGDPRVTVAIVDGRLDPERACFQGAQLKTVEPYWQSSAEIEIDPRYHDELRTILHEHDERVAAYEESGHSLSEAVAERDAQLSERIPPDVLRRMMTCFHGTYTASVILGQHGSPVEGLAPRCRGINIPTPNSDAERAAPLWFTRALDLAIELGADIVHISLGIPTGTGQSHDLLERSVRKCREHNMLVVAPAGNSKGECWVIPAILPGVLAVGAMKDNGEPFKFSDWGGRLLEQGVLAPGDGILGARPYSDEPIRKQGTSCSSPVVTGICALFMSLQRERGRAVDAEAVRAALLKSAVPCDPQKIREPERCLAGKLDIPGAFRLLMGEPLHAGAAPRAPPRASAPMTPSVAASSPMEAGPRGPSSLVVAIGTIGYDFGTEARRDAFQQRMSARGRDGARVPADPHDVRQVIDHLAELPAEAGSLIWTLNHDMTQVYALKPAGTFAADVYRVLLYLLAGQIEDASSPQYVERVSVPGRLTGRTVELLSGQVVPVVLLERTRGIRGWQVNRLVDAAVDVILPRRDAGAGDVDREKVRRSLAGFLHRVYHDLRNTGRTGRERALNHAATNLFQAASTFAEAVSRGMELDRIDASKSAFCRLDSDCWDVRLTFFDPENDHRARRVFLFTIDVSDLVPVTLGETRSWSSLG